MFNNVKLGIAPIGWTNDDMPQLGGELTFEQMVSEAALAGFQGTEVGGKFPTDPAVLNKALDLRGIKIASQWFSSFLCSTPYEENEKAFIKQLDFLEAVGASRINVCELTRCLFAEECSMFGNNKPVATDEEWNKLRRDDGHIYWIQQFQNIKGEEKATTHNDEAFWIQTRVLEWAGYPEVNTLEEYFDLLESYIEANPTMEDGTENIAYTILCEDWRYYCLENAPQFLDGYPNDGSVIVDPDELKIIDYNTTDTARRYFQKLNEEYQKGYVDPESFTQTYDEYIAKLSTGRVLGMVDQWWNFAYNVNDSLKQQGLDEKGCSYVPLPITIDEGIKNQWHNSGGALNAGSGLAITTSCKDVEGALQFIDDLLSQDIHNLRFWGEEGVDYEVDDDGLFYRTEEQRMQAADTAYKASHLCSYSYFPSYKGTSDDGINANWPDEQPDEFFDSLNSAVQKCFKAYGVETYVDMLGTNEAPGSWYPMYSFSGTMTTSTPGGVAWTKMGEIKHEYLPRVVMADDFESEWNTYMKAYEGCNPQDFLDEMQAELDRRMEEAAKFE